MEKLKKIWGAVMDCIEIYVPALMMLALFVSFMLQITSRYIFQHPLVWPYELSQMAYLWIITLGCNYAQRSGDNIVFSVVYDAVPDRVKTIFTLISDVLICVVFLLILPKTVEFYRFYFTRYSTVFKMPLGFVYFGFFIFMIISICRYAKDIWVNIRRLAAAGRGGEKQ